MTFEHAIGFLVLGAVVGFLSGMLGIGGAVLIIPVLVMGFGFTQKVAVGTTLAMLLPPIGVFAVLTYWRADAINVPAAAVMAGAFALGAWGGAWAVNGGYVPQRVLRPTFAVFMLYVAGTMLFRSERRVWAVLQSLFLAGGAVIAYAMLRALGRRWERKLSLPEEYRRRVEAAMAPDYEI